MLINLAFNPPELAKARAEKMKAFKAEMREKARQEQQPDNDENLVPTE